MVEKLRAPSPVPSRPGRGRGRHRTGPSNPADDDDRTATTRASEADPQLTRCRWTCPVCGESRGSLLTAGRTEAHVVNDLRSHLRAAGDDHGRPGAFPPGVDPDDLGRYIGRGAH